MRERGPVHDNEIWQLYERLMPFWAEICGPATEICLYDLSCAEHSLVAVWHPRPGHSTGSALPSALSRIAQEGFSKKDWVQLPAGEGRNADLCCRVMPIGSAEHPLGLLCVTRDRSAARELNGAVHLALERYGLAPAASEETELPELTMISMMRARIAAVITEYGVPASRMSVQEKVEVVHRLSETGILNMKGAVSEIASQLCVSVPTVYRYLNKHPFR